MGRSVGALVGGHAAAPTLPRAVPNVKEKRHPFDIDGFLSAR